MFGCTSGPQEPDHGALYPTVILDTNGNQVIIRYLPGIGQSGLNSSGRISEIQDPRTVATGFGRRSYTFIYDAAATPHLLAISSQIGTAETYRFSYGTQQLVCPFDHDPRFGTISPLKSLAAGSGMDQAFSYNDSAELRETQVSHGGILRWDYDTFGLVGNRSVREVVKRTSQSSSQEPVDTFLLTRDESAGSAALHGNLTLSKPGSSETRWVFVNDPASPDFGLLVAVEARTSEHNIVGLTEITWKRTDGGVPYIGGLVTTLDPGTPAAGRARIEMLRDAYGNLLESRHFDYGNSEVPARTFRHTYLYESRYITRHIKNRLVCSTVSDERDTIELVRNQYDTLGLVDRTGLTEHDSGNFGLGHTIRGNVTESVKGGIYRRVQYDITGFPANIQDGAGYQRAIIPAATTNNTRTGMVLPNGNGSLGVHTQFDVFGRPILATRPNGASTAISYDGLGRVVGLTSPDGATYFYSYSQQPTSVTRTVNGRTNKVAYDGFGRPARVEIGDGSKISSVVEYEYETSVAAPMGCLRRVSLPHPPGASPQWVNSRWDALGRLVSRDLPGSAGSVTFAYTGNTIIVTDSVGRQKKLIYNGLGSLAKVVQMESAGGRGWETAYSYNVLDALTSVVMTRPEGIQMRSFDYDSGGRIVLRNHAESGKERRSYYDDGTLASRTDAKGQRVEYGRDSYGRIVSVKRYDASGNLLASDSMKYYYDINPFDSSYTQNSQGRLAAVQWGDAASLPGLITEMYRYSISGRLTGTRLRFSRGTSNADLDLTCEYDSEGRLASIAYPRGGPSLTYMYDSSGRPSRLFSGSIAIVKEVSYTPAGKIASITQQASENGHYLVETRTYDIRNRLTRIATVPGDAVDGKRIVPTLDFEYSYRDGDGLLNAEIDHVLGVKTTYDYDGRRRLTTAASSDGSWGINCAYDGFGNRTSQAVSQGSAMVHSTAHDPITNRMVVASGAKYDVNGNLTSLAGLIQMSYDVDNRLVKIVTPTSGSESYGYDSANRRIWRKTAVGTEEVYLYDPNGKRLATYSLTTDSRGQMMFSLLDSNVWFGERLIRSRGDGVAADRLGSIRGWSNPEEGASTTRYFPFGEQFRPSTQDREKFRGYVRDSLSGLDYTGRRHYLSMIGRFITPDNDDSTVLLDEPESWNRYTFAANNPMDCRTDGGSGGGISIGFDIDQRNFTVAPLGDIAGQPQVSNRFRDVHKRRSLGFGGTSKRLGSLSAGRK
jgi:RHS repeat-associated protein